MICLAIITDGRDTVHETILSALANLNGPITTKLIYDDSGDRLHALDLRDRYEPLGFRVIDHPQGRQGFGGAIRYVWDHITRNCTEPYVFHLEDDFTFNRPVDLAALATVLLEHPNLVQLALRRQPWNAEERAAGGIVEQHPDDYQACSDRAGREWLEHRRFFTTNPSLYRRSLCERGWPDAQFSEGVFTHQLLADSAARFGFWGPRGSGEWVAHIGAERVGVGY